MRRIAIVLAALVFVTFAAGQGTGVKKRRPRPDEFGNVVMNNFAEKNGMAPVTFSHWVHRARFTCRLCHVDIGFGMQANSTGMHEADNHDGLYCGACHNGRIAFSAKNDPKECVRCHAVGKTAPHLDFATFTADLPRGRFGNNVDWELAELEGKIKLIDTLPEISVKRKPLDVPKDYTIDAKIAGLPEIIFSHKKHAVWNGCELCHPDIYAVKAGTTKYTMQEVFAGKYCGLCHGSVAFPAIDCQRCHTKPVA
jgi:c(7)-type cytochrome triheme protein